ncbi:MAG: hypothetical protein ACT4NX_06885 [Deltaproteobacteria bacterium]
MAHLIQGICLAVAVFLGVAAQAQEKSFGGSWFVGTIEDNKGMYAAQTNSSGAILGQYCYYDSNLCYWVLVNNNSCEENKDLRYPVLANSNFTARSLEMLCNGKRISGKFSYTFANFNLMDEIINKSSRVGVAFPLLDGQFQVNRFTLDWASSAVSYMISEFNAIMKKRSGGTDETI